jgi:hypothetical protein
LKTAVAATVLFAAAATALLWRAPVRAPSGEPALRIRIPSSAARLPDRPDIRVFLHNGSTQPVYITTNLDPFVGGAGMFRNFYVLVSGAHGATQSTRAFLGAIQPPMDEQQLAGTGIIALIQPGGTYSGRLPIDTWADLVPEPGIYRISVGYRGTGVSAPLQYPVLDKHLESNIASVVILP